MNPPLKHRSEKPLDGPAEKNGSSYGPLRKTILSSMILAPVVIFILALAIGYFFFASSLRNSTISQMERVLSDHSQMIDSFLNERRGDLAFVLSTYSYEQLRDPDVLKHILLELQKKSTAFVDLGIFDADGVHINYQGPYDLIGKIYKDEEWFKAVMENGFYISDVFLGFRNIPHFIIAMVKHSPTQTWVIRATIDTVFFEMLVDQVAMGKTGEAFILNAEGLLQTRPKTGGNLMKPEMAGRISPVYHEDTRVVIKKDRQGEEYLTATTWLKNKLWMLVVRRSKADAFQTLNQATYLIVLTTVTGILIIVLISFFLTTRIIQRIEVIDSERQHLRFQLIHASGLAELGEMATGFAHEINNPLQIIKSEQALIQMNITELVEKEGISNIHILSELEDSLNQISMQIDRCAMITKSILKFGRRDEPTLELLNFKQFLPEIIAMVEKRAGLQNIRIHLDTTRLSSLVRADPSQLQQVFLNLMNNAIDAIAEKQGTEGGRIDIKVMDTQAETVDLNIIDNGIGIHPENLKKVFTPFFTTKPAGKGTGLGLSVCYGIVKDLGGNMSAFSTKDGGTAFKVSLPISRAESLGDKGR